VLCLPLVLVKINQHGIGEITDFTFFILLFFNFFILFNFLILLLRNY